MAAKRGPSFQAQWLGQQLKELREQAQLTLDAAADFLQRNASTVSRFEHGIYQIRRPDLMALLELYGVRDKARRDELMRLAEEARQPEWWQEYEEELGRAMPEYLWLESRARKIRTFQWIVPGLLQTRAYAEAVIRAGSPAASEEQAARWVEVRLRRQQVLDRDDPVRLSAVLDESAVRRAVGGPEVMRDQLRHLLAVAERPHIEIRVLPFAAGAHASLMNGFEVLELGEPYPDAAYLEVQPRGPESVATDDVGVLAVRFERLHRAALSEPETSALLAKMADQEE